MSGKKEETAQNIGAALFSGKNDSFAGEFTDKVKKIHEYFDKDKDGYLNFQELSALQLVTSGQEMDGTQYGMVCQALQVAPSKGLPLDALKLTYAAGANIDDDYNKVFNPVKAQKGKNESTDDDVIEVGGGGGAIDISDP